MRAVLAACLVLAHGAAWPQEAVYSEAEVKAAFLYNFANYVEWPADGEGPISIAVLGADGVAAQLETYLPGRSIRDRPVVVHALEDIDDLAQDHILFLGTALADRIGDVVAAVGERPVLIVTDARNALDRGAMVNFQIVDRRVRFEISLVNAERAGLMLSSRLLAAAVYVETSYLWINAEPFGPQLAEWADFCGRDCADGHAPASAGCGRQAFADAAAPPMSLR